MPPTKLLAFVFLLLGTHCAQRETIDALLFDVAQTKYYPLELGHCVEYRIDSLVYDPGPGGGTLCDSSTTFVRELMADTLRDNNGQLIYLIERYKRTTSAEPWVLQFICTAGIVEGQAIRTEQNFRFLKMLFPMDKRSGWDGNLWIDENREIEIAGERIRPFINWHYKVDSIDLPAIIGDFMFDSTLVITEADDTNIIERRFSRSWYAKNVGLVQKEQWILDSQYCNQLPTPPDCASLAWWLKAEKGYILRQVVIAFN